MKKFFFITILIGSPLLFLGNEVRIDSIKKVLPGLEGRERVDLIASLVWELEHAGLYEDAIHYGTEGLRLSDSMSYEQGLAPLYNHLGAVYKNKGDFSKSLAYLFRSEKLFTSLKNERGIASVSLNLGNLYSGMGDRKKALAKYEQKAVLIK